MLEPSKRYRGVFWDTDTDKWQVYVRSGRNDETDGGTFLGEEDAARAYDALAQEILEEPELNFPDDA